MKKMMLEIKKENLQNLQDASLDLAMYEVASQIEPSDDIEFWFAPDTSGMRQGAIKVIERELRPNCRKLIYRDPNGKRILFGLNGKPKFKRLKAA